MTTRHFRIEEDLSFPLDLQFTEPLDLNASLEIGGTMSITESVEYISVRVWNAMSKRLVVTVWESYSGDLPHEHFHSQKPFLQSLSDIYISGNRLPQHIFDRKALEIFHEELVRLKNDCSPAYFMAIDEHIGKLALLIRTCQTRSRPVHIDCRSTLMPDPQIDRSMMQRTIQRMERAVREDHASRFRRFFYGDPVPPEPIPTTLTEATIREALALLGRGEEGTLRDNRWVRIDQMERSKPKMTLGQMNRKLKEEEFEPTLDHEESKVMPGMSKGVAGYIMLNDKLKPLLDQWCDLNTWKPYA